MGAANVNVPCAVSGSRESFCPLVTLVTLVTLLTLVTLARMLRASFGGLKNARQRTANGERLRKR